MLKSIFKIVISVGLVSWLIQSGKIDFMPLKSILSNPSHVLTGFLLLICQTMLISKRWQNLVELRYQQSLSFSKMYGLYFIGSFFNLFLPGAVTGDVSKYFYLRQMVPGLSKRSFLLSILLDRLLALSALFFVAGFFSFYSLLNFNNVHFEIFAKFNGILAFLSLIFLISIKYWAKIIRIVSSFLPSKLREMVVHHQEDFEVYSKNHHKLLLNWLISIFCHLLYFGVFYSFVRQFLPPNISLSGFFAILPIGFVSVALPVSPGGLGVGHVAFQQLFKLLEVDNGASLFNIHYVLTSIFFFFGVFPYWFASRIYKNEKN